MEATHIGPKTDTSISPNATNSPQKTSIDNKPDATLAQLWILLTQSEEINIEFAMRLEMLPPLIPSMPPSHPSGNYLNPSNELPVNQPNGVKPLVMPKLPLPDGNAKTST